MIKMAPIDWTHGAYRDGETYGEHLLEFKAETPGLSLFSVTFG
jgi:hypothetical protein